MKRVGSFLIGLPSLVVVGLITVYQKLVSPNLSPNCRYQPTCSRYMAESVRRFGAIRGVTLGVQRIARCHPMHEGGYDPVPEIWPHRGRVGQG